MELTADENGRESGIAEGLFPYRNEPIVQVIESSYTLVELGARLRF